MVGKSAQSQAVAATDRIVKVCGPAGSGKTEVIVQRTTLLLAQGTAPEDVLVGTSTAAGANDMRERLAKACGPAAARVRVHTAAQECVRILSSPQAKQETGRTPYVLNNFEYAFLLEDLKVLGETPRKLKNTLQFIYEQWANLVPERNWMAKGGEKTIVEFIRESLQQQGAMLTEELAPLCAAYLRSAAGKTAQHAYRYVLWDDFQNLDAAQQTCVCMLAADQLVVCGNANECVQACSNYPNPKGFERFEHVRRNVAVFHISERCANEHSEAFCHAILGEPGSTQAEDAANTARIARFDTPLDELCCLARNVRQLHAGAPEERILVVVPNALWGKLVETHLQAKGVNAAADYADVIKGDPRDMQRCEAQMAFAKLALAANPENATAWRCWCGFGNHLTNSDLWHNLKGLARALGKTIPQALRAIAENADSGLPFARADVLAERFKSAQQFITLSPKLQGWQLIEAIDADELPEFAFARNEMRGNESAAGLFAIVSAHCLDAHAACNISAVRIATPERCAGMSAAHVRLCSAVDGFYPRQDAYEVVSTQQARLAALRDQQRALYVAVSRASKTFEASYFARCDLELAERSKMKVRRIRYDSGEPEAFTSKSMLLAGIADAPAPTLPQQRP